MCNDKTRVDAGGATAGTPSGSGVSPYSAAPSPRTARSHEGFAEEDVSRAGSESRDEQETQAEIEFNGLAWAIEEKRAARFS
jgi:hypothetical protein